MFRERLDENSRQGDAAPIVAGGPEETVGTPSAAESGEEPCRAMRAERDVRLIVIVVALVALWAPCVWAQAPTIPETHVTGEPGSYRSTLGPIPGAGGNPFGMTPGADPAFLGGRPGPSFPRV